MRTIKFRGQFVYTNALTGQFDWVYGDLVHYPEHIGKHKIICEGGSQFEVLASTIGQFTGLYDKNGKEIYEGDILRKSTFVDNDFTETYFDRDTIGVVRILPSCGTTICNCIVYETDDYYEEKKMKERIKMAHVVGKRCEVIGNIYDNPELLKGGEK